MQKSTTTTAFFARAIAASCFRADEVKLVAETTQKDRAPCSVTGYHPDVRLAYDVGGGSSESLMVIIDLIDAGDNYFDTHIEFLDGNQDWASPAVMLAALALVIEKFYADKPWAKYGELVGMNGEKI